MNKSGRINKVALHRQHMIVVNIIGGLGNQMFQYAAGRALALSHRHPMYLDVAGFCGYGLHQGFELKRIFYCEGEIASANDVRNVLGWRSATGLRRILCRKYMSAFRGQSFVVEPHFHYWSGLNQLSGNLYLQGYWQSEKYFKDVSDILRKDFTFKPPLSEQNVRTADSIEKSNAVSLHVRRGDYVANSKTLATHGLCSMEYYQTAVSFMAERIENPQFFIFSDDIPWIKRNFEIGFPCHHVDQNYGAESYNDMRLISLCKNHILANSSFSWWGAWLNPTPEKIVVAPARWFADGTRCLDDLLPEGWVRL